MGDGGGERDGDLGGDGNLGVRGDSGGVVERGIWGAGIFAYFTKQGECWERVDGELVLQGNPDIVEKGIWGVGIFAYFAKQGEFW